jgi:hypothetical protein
MFLGQTSLLVDPSPAFSFAKSMPSRPRVRVTIPSMQWSTLFSTSPATLVSAGALIVILVISFAARAVVFCQYLKRMTGIELKPHEVRRAYHDRGQNGVREMFLDLIIREDLKGGPISVPDDQPKVAEAAPFR